MRQASQSPNTVLWGALRILLAVSLLSGAFAGLIFPGLSILAWLAVSATLVVLLGEGYRWFKNSDQLKEDAEIRRQLERLAMADVEPTESLHEIPVDSAASVGWNRIVQEAVYSGTLRRLEVSIASRLDQSQQSAGHEVLDCLGEGIAITDVNDRLIMVNDALSALIRSYDDETVLEGQSIDELFQQVAGDLDAAESRPRADSLKPFVMDLSSTEDCDQVLRCSRRPHLNDRKEHVGFVWTVRDISQQRMAESTREEFVSMATHELRTPLANIRAYAETMTISEGIDVEQQKSFCNTILSEATRLSRFVDELLDITRMQAGSLTLDRRESDLSSLFQEACVKIEAQVKQKNINFNFSAPDKLPKLNIDKEKILGAVINLLGNAIKYTEPGGTVLLQVTAEDENLTIAVEDTGIGIEESELPRVFDKFFRSDDDRVRDISGSGLGLSFSLEVARLHGGDIEVLSEIDKGTRFSLKIPMQREVYI